MHIISSVLKIPGSLTTILRIEVEGKEKDLTKGPYIEKLLKIRVF